MAENLLQASPPPPATNAKTRPGEVPEKFWDAETGTLRVDALLKSYRELERRLSQCAALARAGPHPAKGPGTRGPWQWRRTSSSATRGRRESLVSGCPGRA